MFEWYNFAIGLCTVQWLDCFVVLWVSPCVWQGQGMDGQKLDWRNEGLLSRRWINTDNFCFIYILSDDILLWYLHGLVSCQLFMSLSTLVYLKCILGDNGWRCSFLFCCFWYKMPCTVCIICVDPSCILLIGEAGGFTNCKSQNSLMHSWKFPLSGEEMLKEKQ